MSTHRASLALLGLGLVIGLALGLSAAPLRDWLAQRRHGAAAAAATRSLIGSLRAYYNEHQIYPASLDALPDSAASREGVIAATRPFFRYATSGPAFVLYRRGPGAHAGYIAACAETDGCVIMDLAE